LGGLDSLIISQAELMVNLIPCIIPFPNQVIIPVCSWRGSYGIPDGLDVLMAYWKLPFIPFNDVRYFCIPWQSYEGEMRQEVIESSSIWQLVVKPQGCCLTIPNTRDHLPSTPLSTDLQDLPPGPGGVGGHVYVPEGTHGKLVQGTFEDST